MAYGNRNFNRPSSNGTTNPCFNCSDRKMGCHAVCERYKKFSEENAARRDELHRAKGVNTVLNGYNPAKKNSPNGKLRRSYREEHK